MEGKQPMISVNYLDLLHLILPEAIVVLAALCVLAVDLMFLRTSETQSPGFRWWGCCRLPGVWLPLRGYSMHRNPQMSLTGWLC